MQIAVAVPHGAALEHIEYLSLHLQELFQFVDPLTKGH
jgi:hypothetical protein